MLYHKINKKTKENRKLKQKQKKTKKTKKKGKEKGYNIYLKNKSSLADFDYSPQSNLFTTKQN